MTTGTGFDPITFKATTRAQWEAAAQAWHDWGPAIEAWLGPATTVMLDDARLKPGSRVLDIAAGAVTGMVVAALAILVANRLLPAGLAHRGDWEEGAFWAAWLLAFGHAVWRTAPVREARIAPAWREQCWAIVVLALAAVGLNWATTGDHLGRTLVAGYWPVAGLDLALLASAAIAALAARRLRLRERGSAEPVPLESDEASTAARAEVAGA